jgi:predicted phage terminase large subunit-like protein
MALEPGSLAIGAGAALTQLTAALGPTDTTLSLADTTYLALVPGFTVLRIDNEQFLVTAVSGGGISFTRGYNKTAPAKHAVGAGVYLAFDQRGLLRANSPSIGAYEAPSLTLDTTSLDLGTTTSGTPGSIATYTITGNALADNVLVTAPAGVELSTDDTNWSTSLTLTPSNANLASTSIDVRISAVANEGMLSGDIQDTSSGASERDLSVSGTIIAPQADLQVAFDSVKISSVLTAEPFAQSVTVTNNGPQDATNAVLVVTIAPRAAFLERECGTDVGLRQQIEELLAAQEKLGSFLAEPVVATRTTDPYCTEPPLEQPATMVAGRYKLLEEIGEGGMGTVWVAEQTEPVRRKVALKLIKPGMDSKSVLAHAAAQMFEKHWFPVIDFAELPPLVARLRSWDLASTEPDAKNDDPDYTAGVLLGRDARNIVYILDLRHGRFSANGVEELLRAVASQDGPEVPIWCEQEGGASGKIVVNHFRRLLVGYRFFGEKSTGSKSDRALPFASYAEAGNVKLVRAPWNERLLSELETFPAPKHSGYHDDCIDAMSLGFNKIGLMNPNMGEGPSVLVYGRRDPFEFSDWDPHRGRVGALGTDARTPFVTMFRPSEF